MNEQIVEEEIINKGKKDGCQCGLAIKDESDDGLVDIKKGG